MKKGIIIAICAILGLWLIIGVSACFGQDCKSCGTNSSSSSEQEISYYDVRIMTGKECDKPVFVRVAKENQPSYLTYNRADVVGYKFLGLFTAASGGDQVTDANDTLYIAIENSVTLYERWTPKDYTIRFHVEDNWDEPFSINVTADEKIVLPQVTEPTGREFVGWALADGTLVSDKNNMKDDYFYLDFENDKFASAVNNKNEHYRFLS